MTPMNSGFPAPEPGDRGSGAGVPRQNQAPEPGEEEQGVRFRDNRKVDPQTGEVRRPAPTAAEPEQATETQQPVDSERVEELTKDLQRVTAEYANYRKRVERDRDLARNNAIAAVVTDLLPTIDDIGRAREHGGLDGGFKAVAEALEGVAGKYGLEAFGAEGEPFDPVVHEAMTSDTSPEVSEPTVTRVYQVGYRIGDRVLRPARVGVTNNE